MTTPTSARARLLLGASATVFALGIAVGASAQPAAPVAPAPKADKMKKADGAKAKRPKNLTPRMVGATETAMGKPLTPALKTQLTTALRAREAAVAAANDKYYADFAAATGLTVEQVREIDKPGKTVKEPTEPGVQTQTNPDQITAPNGPIDAAPTTPKAP